MTLQLFAGLPARLFLYILFSVPIDKRGSIAYNVLVLDTYTNRKGDAVATSVKDIIRRRKSVRTFSSGILRSEARQKLDEFLKALDNPFGVSVEFRFLDAK